MAFVLPPRILGKIIYLRFYANFALITLAFLLGDNLYLTCLQLLNYEYIQSQWQLALISGVQNVEHILPDKEVMTIESVI